MRLINIEAFLTRESLIEEGKPVDRRTKVLDFRDDEKTDYAILSHRWMEEEVEVDYREMVKLAKMDEEERNEIRQRDGYRKIHQSCEQAQANGYEWLWVDTCCIDKRSSAELSEAINSMYRWYQNAKVCYAYLHDVPGPSFPTASDEEKYPKFNGWPERFSRGWTLQELIAPSNVEFFNKDWQSIGDKGAHAPTLRNITGIPEHILTHGLFGNRPCVAQIMSWAARRTTTRVEDRAYSLIGLLDVNMPMLYGEGKKAFRRLQLEIICTSNDQSIFAWDVSRIEHLLGAGERSILADDPRYFRACGEMELMGHDEFIEFLQEDIPDEELDSINEDRLSTFPTTNRGIQIWLLGRPFSGSQSRQFRAWLPCRRGPRASPVTIVLDLLESNYYRYFPVFGVEGLLEGHPQLRQVYLGYQAYPPHRSTTFEIDDSVLTENGFTCCDEDERSDILTIHIRSDSPTNHHSEVGFAQSFGKDSDPGKVSGDTLTLTNSGLCAKLYSDSLTNHHFVVGFAQSFGKGWIHASDQSNIIPRPAWRGDAMDKSLDMLHEARVNAQAMDKARFGVARYGRICIMQTRLNQTTRILQISSVMWMSSRRCGVKLEVFHNPGFGDASGEWRAFDVDGVDDPTCDWRGLMILDRPRKSYGRYAIDGVPGHFSVAPDGTKPGDYGHFTDSEKFCCEGNLFADTELPSSKADITPRQHTLSLTESAWHWTGGFHRQLYEPLLLSLPSNDDLNSLLASLSARLTNRYLVTRVIQCLPDPQEPDSNTTTTLYTVAKPFVWHRNERAGFVSEEWSGDELRGETKGDEVEG